MMKEKIALALFHLLCFSNAFAQHQPVLPGLQGQVLLDSLTAQYKPPVLLGQAFARDTLFAKVYGFNDSLTCVYTGYRIWLDPNDDPTQAAFAKGINTEHTYPQSLGATMAAEGDMHHLYPTREGVNADRGNSPFAEIPDNQTESWYYLAQEIQSIPTSNIALYSEKKGDTFEPREDHKGNVARAMFYFYTMYKEQADLEDPTYFEAQRQTLCDWHLLDPVDPAEWSRTWIIANYQSGRPNPYVLDCTLPERTFCGEFGLSCTPASTEAPAQPAVFEVVVGPNPLTTGAFFSVKNQLPGAVRMEIFDLLGQRLHSEDLGWLPAGERRFFWEKNAGIGAGMAVFRLTLQAGGAVHQASGKLMFAE